MLCGIWTGWECRIKPYVISAMSRLERNHYYLHSRCANPGLWGLILLRRNTATHLDSFMGHSILTYAFISLDTGSDSENLALEASTLSSLYRGWPWNYGLGTWYANYAHIIAHHHDTDAILPVFCLRRRGILRHRAILGTRATSNFLGENGGVGIGSSGQGAFV